MHIFKSKEAKVSQSFAKFFNILRETLRIPGALCGKRKTGSLTN